MKDRPSVFIGSSAEGLAIAEALQQNLDRACEMVLWSQGVFGLSAGTLETLVEKLPEFDFAVLVLTPDDLTTGRGKTQPSPRDNVLLELGLCIGALGRERSFAVYDRTSDIKLPSDLAGVTLADYEVHTTGSLQSALGAASTTIKNAIAKLGPRRRDTVNANIDQSTQFQIIHDLLDPAAQQFMILMHETNTSLRRESSPYSSGLKFACEMSDQSGAQGSFSVDKLCDQLPDAGLLLPDLRENIFLTDRGHEFADWLVKRGHKAVYFESSLGGWGERPEGFMGWFKEPPPDPSVS